MTPSGFLKKRGYLGKLSAEMEKLGVKYEPAPHVGSMRHFLSFIRLRRYSSIIHVEWPELMYKRGSRTATFLSVTYMTVSLILLRYLLRYRLVTLHNAIPHEVFFWHVERAGFKVMLSIAGAVMVHSQYVSNYAKDLYNLGSEKTFLVRLSSSNDMLPYIIGRKNARKKLNLPESTFLLGIVGGIRRYKGVDLLLEALSTIEGNWMLLIAGRPDALYLHELKQKMTAPLSERIKLVDRGLSTEELVTCVEACDVGVIPYREVSVPSSAVMFAEMGIPLIIPALPPIMEYFGEDCCVYFKPNDTSSPNEAIETVLQQPDKLGIIADNAKGAVSVNMWNTLARTTYRIYKIAN